MVLKKVTAVPSASTTPIHNGFKSTNLPDATAAIGYVNHYKISIQGATSRYSKFLQQIFNHKRRRWSLQPVFRLCDLPTSLCA